ncbi:G-protein coupled receptor moody-like [Lytechinus variegatus]|uniref:G-protein coupled receptor moody-like n=1 Tax=Lytechinus variegatus TaxID=7654 RepID=UPI001BB18483|nr:G-protein coupled receptor moody-like [Lytechinus variegatus]
MASNSSLADCCRTPTAPSSSWTASSDSPNHPYQINDFIQRSIVAVLLSLISIIGLGGNALVLLSVLLSRKLQTQTNVFVVNLCVADFLTCLSLPFQAAAAVVDDKRNMFLFSNGFCALVTMLQINSVGCSILTLTLIAFNRFLLITRSKATRRRIFSPSVLVIALSMTWLIPAAEFGIPVIAGFIDLSYYPRFRVCAWNETYPFSKFLIGATLVIALSVTLVCYVKTYLFVRRHARSVENFTPAESRQNVNHSHASLAEMSRKENLEHCPQFDLVHQTPKARNSKQNEVNESIVIESISYQEDGMQSTKRSTQCGSRNQQENADDVGNTRLDIENTRIVNDKSRMKSKSSSRNMEAEISKNLFLVVCAVVVSIVPFVICLSLSSCQEPFIYTVVIICMGSCVNPIIYGFRHPHFRPVFASVLSCRLADIPQPSALARKILNRR